MEQSPVPPILMGIYRYPRMMTSTSEPTILGVLPGRVWLVGQGGVQSIVGREIGQQREIGTALRELLTAVSVAI